jgi:trimethylguanosine synthase
VRLDEDSWAQILPEAVGEHLAMRGQSDVLLDAYCGVGSAAIKFANTCNTVLAADSNILKLECLHNNARIYSADNIIKVNEDFLNLKSTKASTVFLYP